MSKKVSISKYIAYLFLIVLCVIWVVPVLFGISTSFRSQTEVVSSGFRLFPKEWTFENYVTILDNTSTAPIVRWLFNSVFIAVSHTLLVVVIISLTGYGYARMKFKGRDALFFTLLGISFFPGVVNIIPSYKIIDAFGWVNTSLAMIIPGLAGMGNIFLVRQFLKGIPGELDESARVDGAGDFRIYFSIILPLIKLVLIVCGLFSFVGSWNDFLWLGHRLYGCRQNADYSRFAAASRYLRQLPHDRAIDGFGDAGHHSDAVAVCVCPKVLHSIDQFEFGHQRIKIQHLIGGFRICITLS